jgi:lactate dehydrogenase-like 2-hydroxyacid dehydrogenase
MDCNARNVGVVTTSPTAENCARWCVSNIDEKSDLIVLFGNGAIGNRVFELIGNRPVIVITSRSGDLVGSTVNAINTSKFPTIIVTVPLNKSTEGLIGSHLLDNVTTPTQIISISRDGVFDDDSLIEFTNAGKLRNGHFDMISTRVRNELNGRITYYGHTSWAYAADTTIVNPVKVIVPALLDGNLTELPKNSIKLTRRAQWE